MVYRCVHIIVSIRCRYAPAVAAAYTSVFFLLLKILHNIRAHRVSAVKYLTHTNSKSFAKETIGVISRQKYYWPVILFVVGVLYTI